MSIHKQVRTAFVYLFSLTLLYSQIQQETMKPPRGYPNMTFLRWAMALGFLDLVDLKPEKPDSIRVFKDLVYKETDQRSLRLDIYKRNSITKLAPAIIFIHGGGWHKGDKDDYLVYCLSFAEKGYVTASLSYRFSQEAIFPAPLEDIICGIRWIKSHGDEYGIDSSRVALVGGSAGAHLAMMAAYTADELFFESKCNDEGISTEVQAIVNLYGPTDLTTDFAIAQEPTPRFLGSTYGENPDIYLKASPIHYISPDDPPTLTFHGTIDDIVPIYQGDILDKAMKQNGIYHEYHRLKGWPHTMDAAVPVNKYVQGIMTQFFEKWLRGY
ncbi:MAG: alpha/beta hydrolase fold domain-containing protein [Fidelibacterota bacterium]